MPYIADAASLEKLLAGGRELLEELTRLTQKVEADRLKYKELDKQGNKSNIVVRAKYRAQQHLFRKQVIIKFPIMLRWFNINHFVSGMKERTALPEKVRRFADRHKVLIEDCNAAAYVCVKIFKLAIRNLTDCITNIIEHKEVYAGKFGEGKFILKRVKKSKVTGTKDMLTLVTKSTYVANMNSSVYDTGYTTGKGSEAHGTNMAS